MDPTVVIVASFAYLGLLFAIAHVGDRRAAAGRSLIANPYVYALSLAVFATSWTFYGSVGRAASTGVDFLPVYLGPTLMLALGLVVLRKLVRIAKAQRITSLSDFVSSRYADTGLLGGLVAAVAVVGVVPYISLQLKAISTTFEILREDRVGAVPAAPSLLADKALYVALLLAAFTILFGARRLDAAERHEGMVAAIAFESLVKLVAFVAVGVFVTFGVFGGFGDLFGRAAASEEARPLLGFGEVTPGNWVWLMVLSMLAVILLPRQFQIAVVENVDERHVEKAVWLFPLYLLAINVFVLPIALGGLLHFEGGGVDADTFVLALPMAEGANGLALLAFIGGLSAATGMVIVEAIALSTMVSNSIVMPLVLRRGWPLTRRRPLGPLILAVRRVTIVLVLLLGYAYFRTAGEATALVSMGLLSFAAVAQFAPAVLGGIFWRGGTRDGALAGLVAGFALWVYTLLVPSLVRSGWLPAGLLEDGPLGIGLLRPDALLGLTGLDEMSHGMLWSMLLNAGLYVGVSLFGRPGTAEQAQAALFVDVFRRAPASTVGLWRGRAAVADLRRLLERFVGEDAARGALADYGGSAAAQADPGLVQHVERLLAGAVGAASARVLVASVVQEEPLGLDELLEILDEASQLRAYSRELERKSAELERATAELRAANDRLQELDRLKDDFMSTVTHELRTPLTSIRAYAEILLDNPGLDAEERTRFLEPMVAEAERLTRLINQVLDLAKIESGRAEWRLELVDVRRVALDAVGATEQLVRGRDVRIAVHADEELPAVPADRDRVMQVMLNLLSNAAKFCAPDKGRIDVRLSSRDGELRVEIADNGPGLAGDQRSAVFEKFRQVGDTLTAKPVGTGLGLPISREIVTRLGGRIWVDSEPGEGSRFTFTLPLAREGDREVV